MAPCRVLRTAALLSAGILALSVSTARAAGTFDKSSVAANADVDLALNVSVDQLGAYDERVVLEVPNGFRVLTCPKTDDFDCAQSTAGAPSRTLITWKRTTPGAPIPMAIDHFRLRVHTIDRPGAYVFNVHQSYSDNTTADSALKLTVTASATRSTTTTSAAKQKPPVSRAATPNATRHAGQLSPVTDPAWLAETDAVSTPPMEIGSETTRARPSAPMLAAGLIAAAAAGGVFWLRRRSAPGS